MLVFTDLSWEKVTVHFLNSEYYSFCTGYRNSSSTVLSYKERYMQILYILALPHDAVVHFLRWYFKIFCEFPNPFMISESICIETTSVIDLFTGFKL